METYAPSPTADLLQPVLAATEPAALATVSSPENVRPSRSARSIDFAGRRLVLLALTPAGLFGIAVGATAVVLSMAGTSDHIWGLAIVWGAATVVSMLVILTGMREMTAYRSHRGKSPKSPTSGVKLPTEQPLSSRTVGDQGRYQSLKSISPQD
jgi:hypothetical protein